MKKGKKVGRKTERKKQTHYTQWIWYYSGSIVMVKWQEKERKTERKRERKEGRKKEREKRITHNVSDIILAGMQW